MITKHVRQKYEKPAMPQILAGYLTLDTKSLDPANPTTATFSGGLTIYECAEEEWLDDAYVRHQYAHSVASSLDPSTYFKAADPFDECCDIEAILVHADEGYSFSLDPDRYGSFTRGIAETPEALMTSLLTVRGGYTNSTKTFTLAAADNQPILSCTISGLTPGSQYTVEYGCKTTGNDFSLTETSPYGNVTADGTGTATFAFFGATTADAYHALRFISTSDYYDLKLVKICADGSPKTLTNKVYSLTRTAIVDPLTPTPPTKPTVKRYNGSAYEAIDLSETPGTVNLSGDTQNLTISGGTVEAIGSNAPGIGSPEQGKIERGITISGGTVTAKAICSGDCSAPGIGIGGVSGEIHRPITFSGGTVTVIGSGPKAPAIGIISEGRIDDGGDIIIGEDDKPLSLSLTLTRGGSGSGPLGGPTDQNNNFVGKIRIPGLREVALPWDGENADQLGMTRSADGNTWTFTRSE